MGRLWIMLWSLLRKEAFGKHPKSQVAYSVIGMHVPFFVYNLANK